MKREPKLSLKSVIHSKRANIFYLEQCRVLFNDGRVEYVTEDGEGSSYWNIPIANTTTLLLGSGTSITQAAVRELSKAGVPIGFTGGAGTPLYSGIDLQMDIDIAWFYPQSEYRPTEYLQAWFEIWRSETNRLKSAQILQKKRTEFILSAWKSFNKELEGIDSILNPQIKETLHEFDNSISKAKNIDQIFSCEAHFTKKIYKHISNLCQIKNFSREKQGAGIDLPNRFLDYGNYLAYGIATTAIWVLGLSSSLSVLHGKTRRGGLVFDIADLIKDGLVLPQAFISASRNETDQEFRANCIKNFVDIEALDFMIESIKSILKEFGYL